MSRDDPTYSRLSSRFWDQACDEDWTDDMVILGVYLLSCQARTTEGLYRLPKGYMAEDLPGEWPMERLTASLAALVAKDFVRYDDKSRVVFLPKAMKYQRPDNTNQQTAAIRNLKNLPATMLWEPFLEAALRYCEAFHRRLVEAFPQGLAKGFAEGVPQGDAKGDRDSQLCSSSSSISAPLSAPAREDAPQPVDNSDEQSGEEQAPSEEPGHETCDGKPCSYHVFAASAFPALRKAIAASKRPEQWKLIGTNSSLDLLLDDYAGHVCDACQAAFGEFTRPQLDTLCERALIGAVENLQGSQDVQAVMRTRLNRFGLGELIGDRLLEELRRTRRDKRRKGEPLRVGDVLRAPSPAISCKEGGAP